jgi:predicted RNA-binding Zn-ribbon protein involved in translation (DUF1610 family)
VKSENENRKRFSTYRDLIARLSALHDVYLDSEIIIDGKSSPLEKFFLSNGQIVWKTEALDLDMESPYDPTDPILSCYTWEEVRRFVYDSIVPAICTECEGEVGTVEPDCRNVSWSCPNCDAGGEHIKSILVYANLV